MGIHLFNIPKYMIIKREVAFNAPMETVWDLLTNPAMTRQYMFGCEVLSEWTVGSPIIWQGKTAEGKDIIYVKGVITEIQPGEKVSFTMFDPNMGIADIPENYVTLTYQLAALENGTQLTLIQGDYKGVENAEKRFEESEKGWEMVIPLMKGMLEG